MSRALISGVLPALITPLDKPKLDPQIHARYSR
jgi:hypothetical protein